MKYYDINEEQARLAKNAYSFSDYIPGSATAEYRQMVDNAYEIAEQQKTKVDPIHHEKIDYLADRYAQKLADNLNERNNIVSRVPSVMISGRSNFPVHKKEQQNAAYDRNMGKYIEVKGILDKIEGTGTAGISADDSLAVPKLEKKLADMKAEQESMKAINAFYRKHKTLDGCPGLTTVQIEKINASMSRDWRTTAVPYSSYHLSNNNQNMHRVQERIDDLKNRSEYAGWTFAGGKVEANEDTNRLQLFFDEKPSAEQRGELKHRGFKWAPSQGAWQRQLTKNAIYSAGYIDFIKPENGGSPWQQQPFARKAEKKEPGR